MTVLKVSPIQKRPKRSMIKKTPEGLFLSKRTTLNALVSKMNFAKVPLTVVVQIKKCFFYFSSCLLFLQVTLDHNIYNNLLLNQKTSNLLFQFVLHEKWV